MSNPVTEQTDVVAQKMQNLEIHPKTCEVFAALSSLHCFDFDLMTRLRLSNGPLVLCEKPYTKSLSAVGPLDSLLTNEQLQSEQQQSSLLSIKINEEQIDTYLANEVLRLLQHRFSDEPGALVYNLMLLAFGNKNSQPLLKSNTLAVQLNNHCSLGPNLKLSARDLCDYFCSGKNDNSDVAYSQFKNYGTKKNKFGGRK